MDINSEKHHWNLENTYVGLPGVFYAQSEPVPVAKPEIVLFNEGLAEELRLGFLKSNPGDIADYFSGNKLPPGSLPLAQAYAGHQFGHFTMLGDGRAVLLGEQIAPNGKRYDIQLKGSGQTPYSRGGDGRATLYSMLREYMIGEAVHFLGIPTTRSLAVVATGQSVFREETHDGAVLTRTAKGHIRVGTFEYARNFCSPEELRMLTDYTIQRHFPDIIDSENPALEFLKAVMAKQIDLIVDWMRVGFIHGVMNTDNMSISGETIDYGPCAFINFYDPETVFSSIDTGGRYAFGNQSTIARWNLTAFANALLPLISEDKEKAVELAWDVLSEFPKKYSGKYYAMMFGKLGIAMPEEKDRDLVDELLELMARYRADYTQVFMALQIETVPGDSLYRSREYKAWKQNRENALERSGNKHRSIELMNKFNPKVIPRNHKVEDALDAAVRGDYARFNELMDLLSRPYDNLPDSAIFEKVPEDFDAGYRTFCGT